MFRQRNDKNKKECNDITSRMSVFARLSFTHLSALDFRDPIFRVLGLSGCLSSKASFSFLGDCTMQIGCDLDEV